MKSVSYFSLNTLTYLARKLQLRIIILKMGRLWPSYINSLYNFLDDKAK